MPHGLSFHVVGVSHHTAGVQERENLVFTRPETLALLSSHHQCGQTALLLSTCNRCELYWSGDEEGEIWFRELAERRTGSLPAITHLQDMAAVSHLFRVAAGLDSQILGETEILGQVRRAYDIARAAGTTDRSMDLIFSAALSAGRRVRRETMLGRHPVSVSSAAVDLIVDEWGDMEGRDVVVLGAGEAAEGVLRALHERGLSRITLLSRNPNRARLLASAWGAEVGPWSELSSRLTEADLLVVATASSHPVITSGQLTGALAHRAGRELFILDLAVPRNVEPESRRLEGIRLFDLDDLQRLCCPGAGAPAAALADAERIMQEEVTRLASCLRARIAAPQLAELHRLGLELAEQETAWALAKLDTLSLEQQEIVRQMADRLVRRVLYPVSRSLREQEPAPSS